MTSLQVGSRKAQAYSAANEAGPEPAASIYLLACLGGLVLILLPQAARGIGLVELFLVIVGLLGAVTGWRMAPVVLLALLAACQMWGGRGSPGRSWSFQVDDLLVCCGVLAYVIGHHRLQGLSRSLLPPDPRWRESKGAKHPRGPQTGRAGYFPRAARLVTPAELLVFVLTLPLWAILAQLFWAALQGQADRLQLPFERSRLVLLVWFLGVGGLVVGSILTYWRRRAMSPAEAELVLQDVLWRETRREQRRQMRWLAWSRLRASQREERP
jgi:hypothetical protein